MLDDPRFSRPLSAAARLGELAPDHHRFIDKHVLLAGEAGTLATPNGRECMLSSLRLLLRVCPNLSISLPTDAEPLSQECRAHVNRLAFGAAVEFITGAPNYSRYDAVLSVGSASRSDLPWTVINSDGWLARVSSGNSSLPAASALTNPMGALAAACLGVAEVFKRLIRLKEGRGSLLDGLTFSLHSYHCQDADPGPALPTELPLDLLLVGVGAIGNGVIHLLSQLPTIGQAWIVDPQSFQDENLGTCLLIGPQDLGVPKAAFAEKILRDRLRVKGFHQDLEAFQSRLGSELNYPRVVLTALDNIDARHAAQKLWPDLIIDGAIGDFPCQVSRHKWGEDSACLMCLFRYPPGQAAETVASLATGLNRSRMQQADEAVTEDDVQAAPANRQEWLRERLGRQICSVVREAVAQQISDDEQRKGFAPSVPFVACMSACMIVAELVKYAAGFSTALKTRYQLDMLSGPLLGSMIPQEKRRDCQCMARCRNIDTWRRQRD